MSPAWVLTVQPFAQQTSSGPNGLKNKGNTRPEINTTTPYILQRVYTTSKKLRNNKCKIEKTSSLPDWVPVDTVTSQCPDVPADSRRPVSRLLQEWQASLPLVPGSRTDAGSHWTTCAPGSLQTKRESTRRCFNIPLSWRLSVKNSRQEPTPSNGSLPQSMAAPPARRVLGMRTCSFNKTGFDWLIDCSLDSKVHEAYMGPTWSRQDPGGPHVGPMNLAIRSARERKRLSLSAFLGTEEIQLGSARVIVKFVARGYNKFHWQLSSNLSSSLQDRTGIVQVLVNSLRPSDAIWRWRSWSTLVQSMACCLMAPSHYLNQYWLIISEVLWHSSEDIIIRRFEDTNQ